MAKSRQGFYYTHYQTFVVALVVAIFCMLTMVIVVLYQVFHRPLPQFVAVASNNQSLELSAFNEPNYLPSTILKWASKAAVASYTFDFVNYTQQAAHAAQYYTDEGWKDYKISISNLIQSITEKQLFVNSVISGAPIIALQGIMPGKGYVWRIQMPFLVTYQTAETVSRENYYVVMNVVKVPTNIDPTGIGIDQFIMR